MAEWKDHLIQTGVDKLMEYLENEHEVTVPDAADSLDVDDETVIRWAKSLEESGLAEMTYTASRGRIIRLSDDVDETEETKAALEEAVDEHLDAISRLQEEQARLERFEDVLERMEDRLEQDESAAWELESKAENADTDIEELDTFEDHLTAAEEELETLADQIEELERDLQVLLKLDEWQELQADAAPADAGETAGLLERLLQLLPGSPLGGKTFKCEHCEQEFDTERGLETHKGMVHDMEDS